MSEVLVIGRVVHYQAFGTPNGEHPQACRPAMITEIGNEAGRVALAAFNPTGLYFNTCDYVSPDRLLGGTWHWPGDHPPLPI